MMKRLSKYIVLAALTFIGVSAKAVTITDAEVDFSKYTDISEWGFPYSWGGSESARARLSIQNGCLHFHNTEAIDPSWDCQFFPIGGVNAEIGVTYTLHFKMKGTVRQNVSMLGFGQTPYGAFPITKNWIEGRVQYQATSAEGDILMQCGDYVGDWDIAYLKITHESTDEPQKGWVEQLTNGDAETPWTSAQKAIAYNDQGKNYTICAWSREKGRNMDSSGDWHPFPADIEKVDGSHVFVVHGKPATSEGDASAWDNQFWIQSPKMLKVGSRFKLSFRYKASEAATVGNQYHHQNPSDYVHWYALGDIYFTTEWQTFERVITVPNEATDAWSIAFNLNAEKKNAINFYFDDISLSTEGSSVVNPTNYFGLTITTIGHGSVTYGSTKVTNYKSFEVEEGRNVTLTVTPDNGYQFSQLTVNGQDVTKSVKDNVYTISSIKYDLAVVATFIESTSTFNIDDIYYSILSASDKTVVVSKSTKYRGHLTIPETVNYSGVTWDVVGVADNAFNNCSDLITVSLPRSLRASSMGVSVFTGCTKLAAITWNPLFALTTSGLGAVNNPNLLFYTTNGSLAPKEFSNIIVNGKAARIVLQDAETGSDNFYCPTEFTATEISYSHNYKMESAYGGTGGWETLALPFTVQTITHERAGDIVPFAVYDGSTASRPFWLYGYSSSGFVRAGGIEANVPYIICMPNNSEYDAEYQLSGRVTFSAQNTKVATSDGTAQKERPSRGNKTFVAAYKAKSRLKSSDVYAMNVVNDLYSETGDHKPGSVFISNLRAVSPFEAVITTNGAASRVIALDFDETTGIESLSAVHHGNYRVYNLSGQLLIQTESVVEKDLLIKQLPAGVYIVNGKKIIINK